MKNLALGFLVLLYQAHPIEGKGRKNIRTYEILPGAIITNNEIVYSEPDCDPGLECLVTKTCSIPGHIPTLTQDERFFACCAAGQRLLGNVSTAFDCCAAGHDLVGSPHTGYHCCMIGYNYDGNRCVEAACKHGRVLVHGHCACPEGTIEIHDGTCMVPHTHVHTHPHPHSHRRCSSGLEYGNCYILTAQNGNRLGLQKNGYYFAAPDGMSQRYGKFQLCPDDRCTHGRELNPSSIVYIRDTYGDLATGANRGQWLNNAANGDHIGRTPLFAEAGEFSITKWPHGKYCLGGFTQGVGPACPVDHPAMTFYSQDPQMCVEFEFAEVPCNIKDDANNCIWKTGHERCGKHDCL